MFVTWADAQDSVAETAHLIGLTLFEHVKSASFWVCFKLMLCACVSFA